mmetsp:Transcript_19585/g.49783  ORF Transcript_19585/g.49783 Transcript_19585/m.49783 type:complete len:200 (-) Transcript_19585:3575-4174(-)
MLPRRCAKRSAADFAMAELCNFSGEKLELCLKPAQTPAERASSSELASKSSRSCKMRDMCASTFGATGCGCFLRLLTRTGKASYSSARRCSGLMRLPSKTGVASDTSVTISIATNSAGTFAPAAASAESRSRREADVPIALSTAADSFFRLSTLASLSSSCASRTSRPTKSTSVRFHAPFPRIERTASIDLDTSMLCVP